MEPTSASSAVSSENRCASRSVYADTTILRWWDQRICCDEIPLRSLLHKGTGEIRFLRGGVLSKQLERFPTDTPLLSELVTIFVTFCDLGVTNQDGRIWRIFSSWPLSQLDGLFRVMLWLGVGSQKVKLPFACEEEDPLEMCAFWLSIKRITSDLWPILQDIFIRSCKFRVLTRDQRTANSTEARVHVIHDPLDNSGNTSSPLNNQEELSLGCQEGWMLALGEMMGLLGRTQFIARGALTHGVLLKKFSPSKPEHITFLSCVRLFDEGVEQRCVYSLSVSRLDGESRQHYDVPLRCAVCRFSGALLVVYQENATPPSVCIKNDIPFSIEGLKNLTKLSLSTRNVEAQLFSSDENPNIPQLASHPAGITAFIVEALVEHKRIHRFTFKDETEAENWLALLTVKCASTNSTVTPLFRCLHSFDLHRQMCGTKIMAFYPKEFAFVAALGKGSYAEVAKVRHIPTNRIFAMKLVMKKGFTSIRNVVESRRECQSLIDSSQCRQVVDFFGVWQSREYLALLFEFLPGGEMLQIFRTIGVRKRNTKEPPRLHEEDAKFYIAEIALGIDFLRQRGIVHRDLKVDNIVLSHDGHVKICDFGFAKKIGSQLYLARCGTLAYTPPEVVDFKGGGLAADWWSLGVISFVLLTGYFPFLKLNPTHTCDAICRATPDYPHYLSKAAVNFLQRMFVKDPRRRIQTVAELKQVDFFQNFDWKKCESGEMEPPTLTDTGSNTSHISERKLIEKGGGNISAHFQKFFADPNAAPGSEDENDSELGEEDDVFDKRFDAQEAAGSVRYLPGEVAQGAKRVEGKGPEEEDLDAEAQAWIGVHPIFVDEEGKVIGSDAELSVTSRSVLRWNSEEQRAHILSLSEKNVSNSPS